MIIPGEIIPAQELAARHERCRALLAQHCPEAGGLLVFSRVSIYYLSGTLANGVLWLPLEGEPVLLARKGLERARMESSLSRLAPFRSYGELTKNLEEQGSPLSRTVAAEKSVLPWSLAELLTTRLPDLRFIAGDAVLSWAKAVKTPWELQKMRSAGDRQRRAYDLLSARIRPGMNERQIGIILWEIFFSLGFTGPTRMSGFGEEEFLGHIAAGESGNSPSHYNGPLGLMGAHPAVPFMGNEQVVWEKNTPLGVDTVFTFEGYNSDKTQTYFAGSPASLPEEARKAQDLCMEIEAAVAGRLRPGVTPAELYALSLQMAGQGGYARGYMGMGGNCVPFLGHGIGLAIDEWPVLASRFESPLEVGMTIALEPKVGLPGFGMVGTENTYEVTENGGVCLSGATDGIIFIE